MNNSFKLKDVLNFSLRDYQREICDLVKKAIVDGEKKILVQLAGGGGKTKTFLTLMAELESELNLSFIFTTPRINLAKQTYSEAPKALGYLQGNFSKNLESRTLVANIDTLVNRSNIKTDVVIYDEVHMKTKLLQEFKGFDVCVGISATPYDGKGNSLAGWEDAFIVEHPYNERWLIEKGYLTPMNYFDANDNLKSLEVELFDGDGITDEQKEIVESSIVNLVESLESKAGKEYFHNTYSLIVAQSIPHSIEIYQDFKNAGYKVGIYHSKEKKTDALRDIKEKKINLIVAVDKVSVGSDISHLDNVILAKIFSSHTLYRQTVYRGDRLSDGKKYFNVYDFGSNRDRLGNPFIHPTPPPINENKERKKSLCEACEKPLVNKLVNIKIDMLEKVEVRYYRCSECENETVKISMLSNILDCNHDGCTGHIKLDGKSVIREGKKLVGYCSSELKHRNVLSSVNSTMLTLKVTDTRKGIIRRLGDTRLLNEKLVAFIYYSSEYQVSFLEEVIVNSFNKYSSSTIQKTKDKAELFGGNKILEMGRIVHSLFGYIVNTGMLEEDDHQALLEAINDEIGRANFVLKFKNKKITARKIRNFVKKEESRRLKEKI